MFKVEQKESQGEVMIMVMMILYYKRRVCCDLRFLYYLQNKEKFFWDVLFLQQKGFINFLEVVLGIREGRKNKYCFSVDDFY